MKMVLLVPCFILLSAPHVSWIIKDMQMDATDTNIATLAMRVYWCICHLSLRTSWTSVAIMRRLTMRGDF